MLKAIVLSRVRAIVLTNVDYSVNRAIISISSIDSEYPTFNKENGSIKDILYLEFNDEEIGDTAMNDETANKIAAFVKKNENLVDQFVVHCDAGVSRSAGVCAAILKYLTNDDSPIFENPQYCPNMNCYRKTLNALIS